jgi:hypothetical protein
MLSMHFPRWGENLVGGATVTFYFLALSNGSNWEFIDKRNNNNMLPLPPPQFLSWLHPHPNFIPWFWPKFTRYTTLTGRSCVIRALFFYFYLMSHVTVGVYLYSTHSSVPPVIDVNAYCHLTKNNVKISHTLDANDK